MLDIAGTVGSPWNVSAIEVFVTDFLNVAQYTCKDREAIARAFRAHFQVLRKHYEKYGTYEDRPSEEIDEETDPPLPPARMSRRSDVWNTRASSSRSRADPTRDAMEHSRYMRKQYVRHILPASPWLH